MYVTEAKPRLEVVGQDPGIDEGGASQWGDAYRWQFDVSRTTTIVK